MVSTCHGLVQELSSFHEQQLVLGLLCAISLSTRLSLKCQRLHRFFFIAHW